MRIVTYNLHYGGKKGDINHWKRIVDGFSPDLVLAQESYNPQDYFPSEQFSSIARVPVWEPTYAKWGSAILSTKHEITPITLSKFKGNVVGGRIAEFSIGGVTRPLHVFSIHTPGKDYEKSVNEILDCIQEVSDGSDILVGGDFNITVAARHQSEGSPNSKKGLAIFDRLRKEFGLVNSWQAIHPNANLQQTLRWVSEKNFPYHCDGIFIPHSWLRYLETCEIVADGWTDMSDHNPIIATFN